MAGRRSSRFGFRPARAQLARAPADGVVNGLPAGSGPRGGAEHVRAGAGLSRTWRRRSATRTRWRARPALPRLGAGRARLAAVDVLREQDPALTPATADSGGRRSGAVDGRGRRGRAGVRAAARGVPVGRDHGRGLSRAADAGGRGVVGGPARCCHRTGP